MKNWLKKTGQALGKLGKKIKNFFIFIYELIIYAPLLFTFTIIFIVFLVLFCHQMVHPQPHIDKSYRDFDLVIVGINVNSDIDSHNSPQLCNAILLKTTKTFEVKFNTGHLYREINTCANDGTNFHITTSWIYNHQEGDTIHFDYMLKERFFGSKLLDKKLYK
jgi:hypothetical protein